MQGAELDLNTAKYFVCIPYSALFVYYGTYMWHSLTTGTFVDYLRLA